MLIGGAVAAAVAVVALRAHALTRDGAAAAFVVGTLTFGTAGLGGALVLLAFFLTSTALSRAGKARKRELVDIAKGGPRDAWQVLANGGAATVCLVLWAWPGRAALDSLWFVAFAGAYAAATADTWGTEIGTLAAQPPRSIVTGRPLATGLSGGVSAPGTAAEIAGSALIAALTPLALLLALPGGRGQLQLGLSPRLGVHDVHGALLVFSALLGGATFLGGVAGAMIDSLLGETLQMRRWCGRCQRECETDPHVCGSASERRRGVAWLNNDAVNLLATAAGAGIAAAVALGLRAALD